MITQDVLPFSNTVTAREAKVFGAMRRVWSGAGFRRESIDALHKAFRLLTRAGLNTTQAVERIRRGSARRAMRSRNCSSSSRFGARLH